MDGLDVEETCLRASFNPSSDCAGAGRPMKLALLSAIHVAADRVVFFKSSVIEDLLAMGVPAAGSEDSLVDDLLIC